MKRRYAFNLRALRSTPEFGWRTLTLSSVVVFLTNYYLIYISGLAWIRDGLAKDMDGSEFRAKDGVEGP